MSDTVELHGWTDLILPTDAMLTLSSRAFKMLGYYLFRQRTDDKCIPGIRRIGQDLSTDDEKWSDSTIKRTNEELIDKGWVVRVRRGVGKNSETHVFRTPQDKAKWEASQVTSDPTVSSPVNQQSAHLWTDSKNTQVKENTEESVEAVKEPEKPKADRPRNLVFDAIAKRGFGIENLNAISDGGRIAQVSVWVKKQLTNLTEQAQVEKVESFYDWWDREHDNINAPRDLRKFQDNWAAFMSQKSRDQAPVSNGPRMESV